MRVSFVACTQNPVPSAAHLNKIRGFTTVPFFPILFYVSSNTADTRRSEMAKGMTEKQMAKMQEQEFKAIIKFNKGVSKVLKEMMDEANKKK